MENEKLVVFQKFSSEQLARELSTFFQKNDIQSLVTSSPATDVMFPNNKFGKEYYVKINERDFEKAEELILKVSEQEVILINEDYYLFGFKDQDLYEIISKPDEWSKTDFLLAQKILTNRGKEYNIEQLRKERYTMLALPDKNNGWFIIFGYLIALAGGIISIVIGLNLITYKKTLPDGKTIYGYSDEDRAHGQRILRLGIVCTLLTAVYLINWLFKF